AAALGPPSWTAVFIQNLASAKARLAMAGLLLLLFGSGVMYLIYGARSVEHGEFITVDLTGQYNGGLDKSWTPAVDNNHLAALGKGRRVLNHVPFEIHGVVQLQGAEWKKRSYNFPEAVEGIRVGAVGRSIHILHANSAYADPPGTTVASLILHF